MTSNLRKFPANFRETFGILTPKTRKKYRDVIGAFIVQKPVLLEEVERGFMRPSPSDSIYTIHTDYATYSRLKAEKKANCIISFQKRKNGNFAMVRLYSQSLIRKEI